MIIVPFYANFQAKLVAFSASSIFKKIAVLSLFTLSFTGVFAQNCTIDTDLATVDGWSTLKETTDFGGSTFIACETGVLSSITLKVHEKSTFQPNATLFLEEGIGDAANGEIGAADYQQKITISGKGASTVMQLTKPFFVKKGTTYTWYLQKDATAGLLIQAATIEPNNTYLEGGTWYNNAMYATMDNVFSVEIEGDK